MSDRVESPAKETPLSRSSVSGELPARFGLGLGLGLIHLLDTDAGEGAFWLLNGTSPA